jgi:2-aminobenzoate-CoA ligase
LPPDDAWPVLDLTGFDYPEYLNAGVELTDRMVERGFGDRTALIGNGRRRTYKELSDWSNRLANALVQDYGVRPGNRVLIRSANNPAMVAAWLAVTKAGAVAVNTMPMLRKAELAKIVAKAEISHALCDTRLMDELVATAKDSPFLRTVVGFDGTANHDAELDRAALDKPVTFDAVRTGRDDVALLGFTSGTTGEPKATAHFHRDILIVADGYAREVLGVTPEDVFVGSPPLAFTFGLGGLAIFPLRFGAAACLLETASPPNLIDYIQKYRATICFTAPTAYRAMLKAMDEGADLSSLRAAVSAGETLPGPVYDEWMARTGKPMLDGIGATEMLHIFISNRFGDSRPACTGRPVTGYVARIVDDDMNEKPRGEVGRLAVRGPTGCRYLDDPRQRTYVRDGWNLTGDAFWQDAEGYFHFAARTDDIILSAGYNIAGPEVEAALLSHPDVMECAVVGAPDDERGQIVEAHVVLMKGVAADALTVRILQDHVKATIAPYKYPRRIVFTDALPKTPTGKIQRFRLREGG